MNTIPFSKHANARLSGRMAGIVSACEILTAVQNAGHLGVGETAVIVKRLKNTLSIRDIDGSVSQGDTVIAVYRRSCANDGGCITTVELRGSWQRINARWSRVIDLTK